MSDSHERRREDVIVRLAVLEDGSRRNEERLRVVSERTHTLESTVTGLNLLAEEAQSQRKELLETTKALDTKVDILSSSVAVTTAAIQAHARNCEQRGVRLEKAAYIFIAAILSTIGFLLVPYFSAGHHP